MELPLMGVAPERNKEHFQHLDVSYIHLLSHTYSIDNFLRNHYMPSSELHSRDSVARQEDMLPVLWCP